MSAEPEQQQPDDFAEPEPDDFAEPAPSPLPRRRTSTARGGALAAAMLALHEIYYGPQEDTIQIQIDAEGDPPDLDRVGLDELLSDGSRLVGPPLDELKHPGSET